MVLHSKCRSTDAVGFVIFMAQKRIVRTPLRLRYLQTNSL